MLQAITDRIVVRLDDKDKSVLILPDEHKINNKGVVESVGDMVSAVKPGDHIEFHCFDEIPLFENRVVIRESSVLGIYCK